MSATMSGGDNNEDELYTDQPLGDLQQAITFSDEKDMLPSVLTADHWFMK